MEHVLNGTPVLVVVPIGSGWQDGDELGTLGTVGVDETGSHTTECQGHHKPNDQEGQLATCKSVKTYWSVTHEEITNYIFIVLGHS